MFTLGNLLESEGYALTFASSYNNKGLRLIHMLYAVIKKRSTSDYVLIDTYSTQNFYYAVAVSRLCRWLQLKYIPILHGGNLPMRLQKSSKLSHSIFKHAYINVSPSRYLHKLFKDEAYTNTVYIPNTLKIGAYPFKERSVRVIKLLWVRSFSEIYNPMLAVKTLKRLIDQGYKTELCMVGPDSDGSLAEVQQYCNLHHLEVTFTGKLSKTAWIALSQHYNIFINTSNFDNTPVSVIEAMALGLPIVSTNVGGMPYLIDHGKDGLLIEPNHVERMVDAILELYDTDLLAVTIARNARLKVEQFDWEVVKAMWFDILK
jgi:glycosyltransferase involved in cell wall biosynthesis